MSDLEIKSKFIEKISTITLTPQQQSRYDLITKDLAEIIGESDLKRKISENKTLRVYWGTAPTGKIHIGYFFPMKKIADFLCAGCEVTILIADLHAFLDNSKSPLDKIKLRTQYYQEVIKGILDSLGVDHGNLRFVVGSSFQLKPEYTMDLLKLANITGILSAQKASSEVVKQTSNPLLTSLMYPLMQALDEQYLDVDIQFGGIDQRKIFVYAREHMPLIGYSRKIHLMNPMIGGLSTVATGGEKIKMSSSDKDGKLDLLFTPKEIQKLVSKTYCLPGEIKDNTPLNLVKTLLFPILHDQKSSFVIDRPEKFGGKLEYYDFQSLEAAFVDQKLHPADLKLGITSLLVKLTEPVRVRFSSEEMQKLLKIAYD